MKYDQYIAQTVIGKSFLFQFLSLFLRHLMSFLLIGQYAVQSFYIKFIVMRFSYGDLSIDTLNFQDTVQDTSVPIISYVHSHSSVVAQSIFNSRISCFPLCRFHTFQPLHYALFGNLCIQNTSLNLVQDKSKSKVTTTLAAFSIFSIFFFSVCSAIFL